jgi:hypothetical protein
MSLPLFGNPCALKPGRFFLPKRSLDPQGYNTKPDPLAELGMDDDGFRLTEDEMKTAPWCLDGLDWMRGDERGEPPF